MSCVDLFSRLKPKINVQENKKDGFNGWMKCAGCSEIVHESELADTLNCCPKCDYHYKFSTEQRIDQLADRESFKELYSELVTVDPLSFVDDESYCNRVANAKKKSGRDEAICVGTCKVNRVDCAIGVMDFNFMGGSMGSVVGERLTRLIEYSISNNIPLIIVSCSGGARMQESIFSLMQMAKTSAALAKLNKVGLPYISVLTNPTMGGVTASFASLGDIIIAEKGALIGFAGPRVIEQTTGEKLPPGAQTAEFLIERGMIDIIVSRTHLKEKLSLCINFLID